MAEGDSEFDRDTAIIKLGEHRYSGEVSDRWNTFIGPDGGYVLAIGTRALLEEVPFPDPLVVSAHFLRPAVAGPIEIDVSPVRAGRRHATVQASMVQNGKEIVRAVATFADLPTLEGRTHLIGGPPRLPPPDAAIDPLEGGSFPGVSITERVESRVGKLPGWMHGEPSGDPTIEFWLRFRDGREPDSLSAVLLVDAVAPAILELGELGSSTVELTVHLRARPSPGWLACRIQTRYLTNGYHDEDVEIWDSNGNLVAQSRQLAILLGRE